MLKIQMDFLNVTYDLVTSWQSLESYFSKHRATVLLVIYVYITSRCSAACLQQKLGLNVNTLYWTICGPLLDL